MSKIGTIVFDLGGVLIDWNPDYVFSKVFNNFFYLTIIISTIK